MGSSASSPGAPTVTARRQLACRPRAPGAGSWPPSIGARPAQLLILLGPAGGLVRGGLPRLAGDPPAERVLVPQPDHLGRRPRVQPEQLPAADRATRSTGRSCSRTVTIALAGHDHRHAPGLPDRLLHGPGGVAADPLAAVHGRAPAALVELPRPGLRLADHPGPGRAARRPARAGRPPGTGLLRCLDLARLQLPLAAVHDPADLRRLRADPGLAVRGLGRPRRAGRGRRSGGWSCRSSCRPWRPARSSPSR